MKLLSKNLIGKSLVNTIWYLDQLQIQIIYDFLCFALIVGHGTSEADEVWAAAVSHADFNTNLHFFTLLFI
jgi:hypothetical protein